MTSEQPPVSAAAASAADIQRSGRRKKRRHSRHHSRYKTLRLFTRFLLYGIFLVLMLLVWHQIATWTM